MLQVLILNIEIVPIPVGVDDVEGVVDRSVVVDGDVVFAIPTDVVMCSDAAWDNNRTLIHLFL